MARSGSGSLRANPLAQGPLSVASWYLDRRRKSSMRFASRPPMQSKVSWGRCGPNTCGASRSQAARSIVAQAPHNADVAVLAATWSRGPRTCGAGGGDVVEAIYQSGRHSLAMQKVGQRLTDGHPGASVRCNGVPSWMFGHDHPVNCWSAWFAPRTVPQVVHGRYPLPRLPLPTLQ